jgi:Histidine kinase-, DNA gyrase B-, and HSP90-like ATPase
VDEAGNRRSYSVLIEVVDQGAGIDMNKLKDLVRAMRGVLDQSDLRTGLVDDVKGFGLITSKAILQLHRGRLWIKSDGPGTGCTVTIELPLFTNSIDKEYSDPDSSLLGSHSTRTSAKITGLSSSLFKPVRIHAEAPWDGNGTSLVDIHADP